MFNYKVQTYENGAWADLKRVALPLTDGDVLDETLAEGKVDTRNTKRSASIKPFTRLRIIKYDGDTYKGKIQRYVGTTKKTKKRINSTPLFDYDIQTLELTKGLERIIVGSMTSTKWLEHNYDTAGNTTPTITGNGIPSHVDVSDENIPTYQRVYKQGNTVEIPQAGGTGIYHSDAWMTIVGFLGITYKAAIVTNEIKKGATSLQTKIWTSDNPTADTSLEYTFASEGSYSITTYYAVYMTQTEVDTDNPSYEGSYTWSFSVYTPKHIEPQDYTITSIVERLLSAGKTRRKGIDAQKITFNAEQATKYANTPYDNPPEFGFTNSTMLDALMQIGGAIHAIPRLQVKNESETSDDLEYEVVFDELGGSEDISDRMPPYLYEDKNYDINDYCGELDSPAQNLVNSQNVEKGCVSEFGDQYITLRTETTQVEISADTAAYQMPLPNSRLVQYFMYYNGKERDISPYVYEKDEYGTLSQLEESRYPYSTGWALCYEIGSHTITGFNNKLTTSTVLTKPLLKYAIANIWQAVTGENLPETDVINCAFRAVYVPIVEARITQRKPFTETDEEIALVYNQGANLVETNAFGQKLRGAAARLGQEITQRTYDFFTLDNLPKVGQIVDGAYIAQANYAFFTHKVRVTLVLTPNFNLLSQYVGLNTNYRLADISTKQVTNRYITYGNTLIFGDNETNGSPIIPLNGSLYAVDTMLKGTVHNVKRINSSLLIGYDEDGNQITDSQVLLPVVSFPFGISWAFVCACLDNYGAGYQAVDGFDVIGVDNITRHKRVQRLVPYADAVGEIEYLGVWWSGQKMWDNNGFAVADGGDANIYPYASNTTVGKYKGSHGAIVQNENDLNMTTGDYATGHPFILKKDSKERIGVVYQMHLQANRDSVVIGSALADNCPLCTNYTANAGTAYVLPHTINTFGSVDLTGATQTTFSVSNGQIVVANPGIDGTKSWVIVDTQNNIYIGENTSENDGGYFPTIYISTK